MKTLILLMIFVVSFSFCKSQNYIIKNYTFQETDKYKPVTAGALAIIPGAGHFYTGHYVRGILFPAGMAASAYLISAGSLEEWADGWSDTPSNSGDTKMLIGGISFFAIYIWSFFDAVKVAKIKNIRFRERELSFRVEPFLVTNINNSFQSNVAGLILKLNL